MAKIASAWHAGGRLTRAALPKRRLKVAPTSGMVELKSPATRRSRVAAKRFPVQRWTAMSDCTARKYWAWAPARVRPRRLQKKITARGGALHHLPAALQRDPRLTEPSTSPYDFHALTRAHRVVRAPSRGAGILYFERSRIIRKSHVGDAEVSTIFLGCDHRPWFLGD